jgi:hypothetical protein
MNEHPNKHIRAALDYALSHGWTLRKAGARAHIWGRICCPQHDREGCQFSVFSTPRVPEDYARWIRRAVDRCPHVGGTDDEDV